MDTEHLPIALNVNLDSLSEACGFPGGFRDPSFFQVFDRIEGLAARVRAKLTVFVIGRDLEDPEVFARVRSWARAGHEIGNHTWSHPLNLGALPRVRIREEIRRAHDRIAECAGAPPRGFVAPNWSLSRAVIAELVELGYTYDTSLFPSVFLYALVAKCTLNTLRYPARLRAGLGRRDWFYPLARPVRPHFVDERFRRVEGPGPGRLLELPLPAVGRFDLPCWHTLGFVLGRDRVEARLRRLLRTHPGLYYLMHPADFTAPEEFDPRFRFTLERMAVPLAEKMERAEAAFHILAASGRPFATLGEAAERIADAGTGPSPDRAVLHERVR